MKSIEHFVKERVNDVFMSEIGFGQDLKLVLPDGKIIYTTGSLQSDNLIGRDLRRLQEHSHKLFIHYPLQYRDLDWDETGDTVINVWLNVGMKIVIDNASYTITAISDECGIAEVDLMRKG